MTMKSLGKNTEYPVTYSPDVLELINREDRRTGYTKMYGVDIWHCYECSFLLTTGKPYYTVLRIYNECNSTYIWESKSLKLYLFSMNNTIFNTVNEYIDTIKKDIEQILNSKIHIEEVIRPINMYDFNYGVCLDDLNIFTDIYTTNKVLLESISYHNNTDEGFKYYTNLLRSNCRITNQPDWARCYIEYIPNNKILIEESLLKYIISYRNHQEFHEPTCESIYQDIFNILQPKFLCVICQYTRRGGIDITPIRISDSSKMDKYKKLPKILQQ